MGGRGASSGISDKNNKYGTQYTTILKHGNIKFVTKNGRYSEPLLETKTKGRVYVTVGGDDILQILYFDKDNKKNKTIDLKHKHNGKQPHTHHGYLHNEFDGNNGATLLTSQELKMVDRVKRIWYAYKDKW